MQKFFIPKGLLLFTLIFIAVAAFSFIAFRETTKVCDGANACSKLARPPHQSGLLWEVVTRQFFSLLAG